LIVVASFAVMAVVTDQVIRSSIRLVDMLPISASFFGVIFLGIATSLPELSTALLSIRKGKKDMSAGIMLGSNVTNLLLGLGIGGMISTYTVPQVFYCMTCLLTLPPQLCSIFSCCAKKTLTEAKL
jgi:cation:H+ antiporter